MNWVANTNYNTIVSGNELGELIPDVTPLSMAMDWEYQMITIVYSNKLGELPLFIAMNWVI